MAPGVLDQAAPMPLLRPPDSGRLGRSEGRRHQPEAVQPLQPLTVMDIRLGAVRSPLHLARIDQQHLTALLLQEGIQREPLHPGRFQRPGRDATLMEPGRDAVEVHREHAEAAAMGGKGRWEGRLEDDSTGGHTDPQLSGADINTRGVGVERLQEGFCRGIWA
jgi:hypothetical protein